MAWQERQPDASKAAWNGGGVARGPRVRRSTVRRHRGKRVAGYRVLLVILVSAVGGSLAVGMLKWFGLRLFGVGSSRRSSRSFPLHLGIGSASGSRSCISGWVHDRFGVSWQLIFNQRPSPSRSKQAHHVGFGLEESWSRQLGCRNRRDRALEKANSLRNSTA